MIIPEKQVNPQNLERRDLPVRSEAGPVLAGRRVRMAPHAIVVADHPADGVPSVSLRRDGDIIREIQIRCSCGELIILDCEYPPAA